VPQAGVSAKPNGKNNRQALMQRIYPTCKESVGVVLFSKGGPGRLTRLQAWDMMASNAY